MAIDFTTTKKLIQTGLVEKGGASLAVAVAKDGEIIWQEGFGFADRETQRPASPDTS